MQTKASQGDAALAHFGRSIDDVGELTVSGIIENRLYLPTDRLAEQALTARCAEIVAAMPDQSDFDNALHTAMQGRVQSPDI